MKNTENTKICEFFDLVLNEAQNHVTLQSYKMIWECYSSRSIYLDRSEIFHCIFDRSKSRIRRLSEHIIKDSYSTVQGDNGVRKSFHLSCDDLRKEKSKTDTYKASFLEGKNQSSYTSIVKWNVKIHLRAHCLIDSVI